VHYLAEAFCLKRAELSIDRHSTAGVNGGEFRIASVIVNVIARRVIFRK
jgi:hypothetical protein